MKKIILMILSSFLVLLLLTSCGTSIEGKWHCTKYTEDDETITNEQCKENLGYGLDEFFSITFEANGLGTLSRKQGKKNLGFDWKASEDSYILDFDDYDIDKASAKIDGSELTVIVKGDGHKLVVVFEKD